MKKCLLLLLLLVLAACRTQEAPDTRTDDGGIAIEETPAPSPEPTLEPTYEPTSQPTAEPDPTPTPEPHISSIPLDGILTYFANLEAKFDEDGGAMWGVPLHMPFMFYDPETHHIVANMQDPQGVLMPQEGVYVGVLPQGARIDNTGVNFAGVQWAMMDLERLLFLQSLDEDFTWSMVDRVLQAWSRPLFGQRNMGTHEFDQGVEQRVLMRTEMNALLAAIQAGDEESRMETIHAALSIRAHRHETLSNQAYIYENDQIIASGINHYTLRTMFGYEIDETYTFLLPDDEYYEYLPWSFGNHMGLFYATLLDAIGADWRHNITYHTALGELLAYHAGIDTFIPIDELDLDRFGYSAISEAEHGWVAFRQGLNERARELFTLGRAPVLWMRTEGEDHLSNGIFLNVTNLGKSRFGIVFHGTFTLEGEFGTLHGENAMRMTDTFDAASGLRGHVVSAVDMRIEGTRVTGHGWEIELNEGFIIIEVEPGHFWVRRES